LGLLICIITCKFCGVVPFYMQTYNCCIYYVVHKLHILTKATIHLNIHIHLVQNDMCKEALKRIKVLVEEEVFRTFCGKNFTFLLFTNKSLSQRLFNENGHNLVIFCNLITSLNIIATIKIILITYFC
jgi:RNase P subunit RPR2